MTVELWYGSKPTNYGEQSVLIELYDYLKPRPGLYILMANFYAGLSNEIDLMVIKRNAIFLVELKNYATPLVGEKEGDWTYTEKDGSKKNMRNPFKQVRANVFAWKDWCKAQAELLEKMETIKRNFRLLEPYEYIVVFPELHAKSDIKIGEQPVHAMGFDKFRAELVIRNRTGPELDGDELRQIPRLLKLTRWHVDPPDAEDLTVRMGEDDFQKPIVRMLVSLGHEFSTAVKHIEKEALLVGRNPACDLVINHPSVSRTHAIIRQHEGRWIVEDLGSDNGTFVCYNGDLGFERAVHKMNALKNGSIIRFGQTSYTFVVNE